MCVQLSVQPSVLLSTCTLFHPQVQEAFALTDSEAAAAPKGYATRLKGAGKVYNVYVHRWEERTGCRQKARYTMCTCTGAWPGGGADWVQGRS